MSTFTIEVNGKNVEVKVKNILSENFIELESNKGYGLYSTKMNTGRFLINSKNKEILFQKGVPFESNLIKEVVSLGNNK